MTVLGFMELPEDDVPPEEIWHDAQRIEEWFEAVKSRRESGMEPVNDQADSAPMLSNEETAKLIGR